MKSARWFLGALCVVAASIAANADVAGFNLVERIAAASPGAVIDVPAGRHAGPLSIDKPLELRGAPGAIVEGKGHGHVIAINAADVTISGLLIRGSGGNLSKDDAGIHVIAPRAVITGNVIVDTLHGIYLKRAPECRIIGNTIRGRSGVEAVSDPMTKSFNLTQDELCSGELGQDQRGNGIHIWNCGRHLIEQNDIRGTRDGIYFSFCDETVVRSNNIREVRYGLHYMYSDDNLFEENTFSENAAGSALMYSSGITLQNNRFVANRSHRAYGLLMHTVENTTVAGNLIEGNTIGMYLDSCVANSFSGNELNSNYIGMRLADSSDQNRFWANVLRGNIHQVETGGGESKNDWVVSGRGNFWDDALKLDLDRDGVADVAHLETDLFGPWRREFPEVGLLSGSPGERAIRFVHARVHLPGIPGVKDSRPLTSVGSP